MPMPNIQTFTLAHVCSVGSFGVVDFPKLKKTVAVHGQGCVCLASPIEPSNRLMSGRNKPWNGDAERKTCQGFLHGLISLIDQHQTHYCV